MATGSGVVPTDRRVELLVAVVVATGLLGLTAFAGLLVVAAMTATGVLAPGTSTWMLLALLAAVLATGVAAAGGTAWLAWHALGRLRSAAVAAWRRFLWTGYSRARAFEDRSLLGRVLRPARLFEAKGDREGHLVAELKNRYVAGELDEADFEHELGRLLGGGATAGRRVRREIEVTAPDGGAGAGGGGGSAGGERSGEAGGGRAERDREPEHG